MHRSSLVLAAILLHLLATAQAAETAPPKSHEEAMTELPAAWRGSEQIALVAYPGMTALDLMGPQYMLANLWGARVRIVAKTMDPVMSDTGVAIVPTDDFASCPTELDILLVPGGSQGTLAAVRDPELIAFVRERGGRAKLVTSVCTGSLVLGTAGLLQGRRATSHWVVRDLLPLYGATPVDERVVVDGNIITGAGVTAGLDLGLVILQRLRDDEYARSVMLLSEYDPRPPVDAGTPAKAGERTTAMMASMFVELREGFRAAAAERAR
jgi:cyclohexyl-isocyanide hydratase